jgi:serine/threonine protein kinase/Tol biopolymer transport system component
LTLHGTIGHYQIVEPIGEGGMGEVYAAEDTRLHRRVALKVLPRLLAADPERRQRFEREAHTIAALNHPNIVTIHSVEEVDGTLFLTMELVDGKPLSELIPRDGLPVSTALKIAIGVSDAMAAAQQRGITHRDLKPANVMLTAEGRVKVLDFGVAKLRDLELAAAAEDLTRGPTRQLTGEGKIIGTIAYMSPEQAEAKPVDPRSDIFSLGVLLHEMVTGDRPFKGDTNVSIISSILKDTPAPVTDLNPGLPAHLARIIRRCLAKDPVRRYQSAVDLRNELEDLKQDVETGVATAPTAPPKRSRMWIGLSAAAGMVLVAAALWFVVNYSRRSITPATFTVDHFTRLTTTGTVSLAAISADGRYVVHVKGSTTDPSLWVRQTATTSDVQIVPPAPVVYDGLAFSPDGNYVYYNTYRRPGGGVAILYRVPVLGGTSAIVLEDVDSAIAFAPDGRSFAFTRGAPAKGTTALVIANTDGSGARELTMLPAPNRLLLETPAWSPDGRTILAIASNGPTRSAVFAIDAQSGRPSRVPGDWAGLRAVQWLPDGQSFLANAADLNTPATLQIWSASYPAGERTHVTNDLNSYFGVSLSGDGLLLATVQTQVNAGIETSRLPQLQEWRRVTGEPGRADGTGGLTWLPDGRIVFTSASSGAPQLWVVNDDGSSLRQLTTTLSAALNPFASRDGRWVYFDSLCATGRCLYRIAPDGSGLEQITRGGTENRPVVSPDGSTVFFSRTDGANNRAARVPAQGGEPTNISKAIFSPTGISPDGTQLVGPSWSEELRRPVVALLSVTGGDPRVLPDIPALGAVFVPDGSALFFPDLTARPVRLMLRPLPDGEARPLGGRVPDLTFAGAMSRDGRIAVSSGTRESDAVLISAVPARKP